MATVITLGLGLVQEVNENISNNRAVADVSCGRKSRQLTVVSVV